MSTGFIRTFFKCKIGKKADKSDCSKKNCDNCRHWIQTDEWQDCMNCKGDCIECPNRAKE